MTNTRGDLAWVLVGVLALTVIGVKVGHLLDLDLRWTYAVTAAVYVAVVSAWGVPASPPVTRRTEVVSPLLGLSPERPLRGSPRRACRRR